MTYSSHRLLRLPDPTLEDGSLVSQHYLQTNDTTSQRLAQFMSIVAPAFEHGSLLGHHHLQTNGMMSKNWYPHVPNSGINDSQLSDCS